MNKKLKIVLFSSGIIIIIACLVIQLILNQENTKLENEKEKLQTLTIKTKSGQTIKTNYTHIDDKQFYIKIPEIFKQLDQDTIKNKYQGDIPDIVFSNEETTVNIVINLTENQMNNNQIKDYHDTIQSLLKENSEIIHTDLYEIDNHNIGSIKVKTQATDTNIYNHMIYFSYQNKLVIIAFNCTSDLQEEWQPVGDFIINSLFFKE